MEKCAPCSKCDGAGIVVEECNASRDTICTRGNITQSKIQASKSVPTGKCVVINRVKRLKI